MHIVADFRLLLHDRLLTGCARYCRWRAPDNPWRKEPFKITHLPTLVKFTPEEVCHPIHGRSSVC